MSNVTAFEATTLKGFLGEQAQASRERAEILGELLSTAMSRRGWYLAFASGMGRTGSNGHPNATTVPSYTVLHSLEWISQNIRLGSEMPFMANKIDHETGRLVVDCSNAEEVKQRAPDWTRQAALAAYLAQSERKFGPIMAVISPEWVEDSEHAKWNANGRAVLTAAEFVPIEPGSRVGLLKLDGVRLYALDGQHRVLGMRGLRELRDRGFLQLRAPDGTPRGGTMSRQQFFSTFRVGTEDLQSIFNDTMPVEYTPAVVKGETHNEATRRIRRTFIAINSYAKKTDKGENILLDETDGYSIVARRLGVHHPLFGGDGSGQRVDWKSTSISSKSSHLATLSTLKDAAAAYLPVVRPEMFGRWRTPVRGMVPIRPPDHELDLGSEVMFELFDYVRSLPVFRMLQQTRLREYQSVLARWRELSDLDALKRSGELFLEEAGLSRGHLLLRPLGQVILVKAVAELVAPEDLLGGGLTLGSVFRVLRQLDSERGFEMTRPQSVWYGVTYDPVRGRLIVGNRSWAHRLLVHLVNGTPGKAEEVALWRKWLGCRIVDTKSQTWRSLDGRILRYNWNVSQLPKSLNR